MEAMTTTSGGGKWMTGGDTEKVQPTVRAQ